MTAADPEIFYVEEVVLKHWFAQAADGARFIFAHGPRTSPAAPVRVMIDAWMQAGTVRCHQQRLPSGVLAHVVVRVRKVVMDARGLAAIRRDLNQSERRVLKLIEATALRGGCTPSPREMAVHADLRSTDAARYVIVKLEKLGLIRRRQGRVIEIVGSGIRTKGVAA